MSERWTAGSVPVEAYDRLRAETERQRLKYRARAQDAEDELVPLRRRLAEVEAENERLRSYLSDYTAKLHRLGAWDR